MRDEQVKQRPPRPAGQNESVRLSIYHEQKTFSYYSTENGDDVQLGPKMKRLLAGYKRLSRRG